MNNLLLAVIMAVPAMVIVITLFVLMRKQINAEYRENKRRVKVRRAKLYIRYSNLRDTINE